MTRERALDDLKQGLKDLLSLLDGGEPTTGQLLRAVSDCDVRMAALKRAPAPSDETAAERDAYTASMEEALRLNSVARGLVESQGRELMSRLERVRGLRRGLADKLASTGDGRSVDVAG